MVNYMYRSHIVQTKSHRASQFLHPTNGPHQNFKMKFGFVTLEGFLLDKLVMHFRIAVRVQEPTQEHSTKQLCLKNSQ